MKRFAIGLALLTVGCIPPATAVAAVAPGGNGLLIFTSGRGGAADDSEAKIWAMPIGAILPTQITFDDPVLGNTRHSHPTWSPDGLRIAYSKSESGAGARDIWIRDLSADPPTEINITQTATIDEDRAEFSPDGTKIAYGDRAVAGADATTEADIWVQGNLAGTGNRTNITATGTTSEDRPAWSPDGQFIYVARDTASPYNDNQNIVRLDAANGANPTTIVGSGVNEWQPQISPDGTKVCYSSGGTSNGGGGDVDVYVADTAPGSTGVAFKESTTMGEFNCTWSPDGQKIAYVFGVFGTGGLNIADYPGGGNNDEIADEAAHFDGNPSWGANPPPVCNDGTASVAVNGVVEIPLSCTDRPDPLEYDPNPVGTHNLVTPPAHGSVGGFTNNESVFYTPAKDFKGTDTFSFDGEDELSTSAPATITVTVGQDGGGGGQGQDPELEDLAVSPKRWKRGTALPTLSATTGTTISFTLSEAASTRLSFTRARPGRRVGGKCRKPTRANKGKRRCTRYVRAGSLTVNAESGANRLRFQGRLSNTRRLKLGKHRVTASATDGDGNASNRLTASFRIVRR